MNDQPEKNGEELEAEPVGAEEEEGGRLREISAEELKEILEAHERWLATDDSEGNQADLQGADLSRANLQRAGLRKANLQGAVLEEAKLQQAYLSEANLQKADLSRAKLQGADLDEAKLRHAGLIEANLQGACLSEANLQQARLQEASLQDADLHKANLQGAKLNGVDLQKAILHEANLQGANLSNANLRWANLQRTLLSGLEVKEDGTLGKGLLAADLKDAELRNADLRDAKLSNVAGLQADQLAGANLSNAKLPPDIAKFDALDHVAEISKHARNIFLAVVGGCVYSWLTIATTTDLALVLNSASTPLPIIQTKVPIAGFYWAAPMILIALYFYLHIYMQRMWEGLASLPAVFPDGRTLDQKAYPWLLTGLVRAHVPLLKEDRPPLWGMQFALSIVAAWVLVPFTVFLLWLRLLPRHDWTGTIILMLCMLAAIWGSVAFYRRMRATLRGEGREEISRNRSHEAIPLVLAVVAMSGVSGYAYSGGGKFDIPGFGLYADLKGLEISIKPPTWSGMATGPSAQADFEQVKGAALAGANLRGAAAAGAFLAKANLEGANLQAADLVGAHLRWANLDGANLQGANLRGANLKGANLANADLQGARLQGANLKNTNVTQTQLDSACGDNSAVGYGLTIKPCPETD